MPRVKTGIVRRRRHKKMLKFAKGYFAGKSKHYKKAKEQVIKSFTAMYIGRKRKKRDFRRLWIVRINAACRIENMSYSRFMHGLKLASVDLDRKILANIVISDEKAFKDLIKISKEAIEAHK